MREFTKISPAIWNSQRFKALPEDNARFLMLYFLTCMHQNNAGCYYLPDGYALSDLDWEQGQYEAACKQLVEAGLIRFDPNESVVMIDKWFEFNPPMNPSHRTGIEHTIERIPSESLSEACHSALESFFAKREAAEHAKQAGAVDLARKHDNSGIAPRLLTPQLVKRGR
ncbi:MAG: hypothetical protein GY947_22050 [Rhodobacteraceae bacterium]|nr:hypothetical protein [Paracoccaceae bacterium]